METRELYRQKYEAQIHEWSAKLDELKARSEKMTAQARIDAKPHMEAVHAKMDAAKLKLRETAAATDDTWEEVKKAADGAWQEAKSAVEGAYEALKGHAKKD